MGSRRGPFGVGGGVANGFPWDEVLFQSDYWLDAYRTKHPIASMSTRHIRNAIPYAEAGRAQLVEAALRYADWEDDTQAAYEAQTDARRLMANDPPLLVALREELARREGA